MVDPLLKWPGSKSERRTGLVAMLSVDPRPVFCDPMCGSVSVPLAMPLCDRGAVVLGDAGPRLVPVYRAVRRDPEGVHRALSKLAQDVAQARAVATASGWVAQDDRSREGRYSDPWKAYYYHQRTTMNAWQPLPGDVASDTNAALFIWVQRAAFNGLFRTGKDGGSSATVGDRVTLPGIRHLVAFAHHLRGATLVDGPFETTAHAAQIIGPTDLFLDPPYSGDYDGYTFGGFDNGRRAALAQVVQDVVQGGGRVLVTEADHPDAWAWLTAAGLHVQPVQGRTSISRSGAQRGAKSELVARSWAW